MGAEYVLTLLHKWLPVFEPMGGEFSIQPEHLSLELIPRQGSKLLTPNIWIIGIVQTVQNSPKSDTIQ